VNAQMQFDMYHHYTVDEHTIRAIGLLARIERGDLSGDHPLATQLIHKVHERRALYLSVLLHDIAKGRRGDHSQLGADIARRLCPRLGLDPDETELVAWLVRNHLLMSAVAFKRDLADWKTITDFVASVQSLERLRTLTMLTIVDIRAVGPGVWNSWKRQLLAELYELAEERLRLGHALHGREQRVAAKKELVAARLGKQQGLIEGVGKQLGAAYWIAEPDDIIALNLVQLEAAKGEPLDVATHFYAARGATLVTVIAVIPPIAVLPILFIALGLGEASKIALIALGIAPYMIRDLAGFVAGLPAEQFLKAQTLGASTWQLTLRVALPQALPRLIDSLRLSMGPAWVFLISAEAIASDVGLGYRIFLVRRYLSMDIILPYVAWISLLAILTDWALQLLSRKAFPWAHGAAR